jgi:hypothetical protein
MRGGARQDQDLNPGGQDRVAEVKVADLTLVSSLQCRALVSFDPTLSELKHARKGHFTEALLRMRRI